MDHLDHERNEMHVMFWSSTMCIPRERVFISKPLHEHLKVMQEDLNSIRIDLADVLLLCLEIALNHTIVIVYSQLSTSNREEVVTFCVVISNGSTLPFSFWMFQLLICSVCILMASEVNKARMSDSSVTNSGCESESCF